MTDIADATRSELLERLAHFRTPPRTVLDLSGGVTDAAADALLVRPRRAGFELPG